MITQWKSYIWIWFKWLHLNNVSCYVVSFFMSMGGDLETINTLYGMLHRFLEGQILWWVQLMYSIPGSAQHMTLPNYFSHPSLVIYFSPTPPIKVRLGLQRGGRLLNSNSKPPWTIFIIDQSTVGISSQIIFITLFCSRC